MTSTGALLFDAGLVAGFGVQHSLLASLRVKRIAHARRRIDALAWRSVESMVNVVYVLVAASLWQRTDDVLWHLTGAPMVVVTALGVASWLWYWQLHLFEYDCGLAFGSTTLVAHLAHAPTPKAAAWKVGSRRWIRFPVHTAFFGMFFGLPVMTTDLFVLAVVANTYNVIGSVLYDLRLKRTVGERYAPYVQVTGLILPPLYRAPRGAAGIPMASPTHWRRPARHLPGLVAGVGIGILYWTIIGPRASTPGDMLRAGLAGLAAALLAGLLLGRVARPDDVGWDQQQTDLSTTVATAAAVGVVSWVAIGWVVSGVGPSIAAFLPLWFTVQYFGHVFAFLADRRRWSPVGADLDPGVVPRPAPPPVVAGSSAARTRAAAP